MAYGVNEGGGKEKKQMILPISRILSHLKVKQKCEGGKNGSVGIQEG